MHPEGMKIAKNLVQGYGDQKQRLKFLDQEIDICHKIRSPRDIIWENERRITPPKLSLKRCGLLTILIMV